MSEAMQRAWELREEAAGIRDDMDDPLCLGDVQTDDCEGCLFEKACKKKREKENKP
jgi:hypothetical protein